MEGNYANVFNARDNIYPNDPSLVTEDFQSGPYSLGSNPYYPSYIPLDSFGPSLDYSGFVSDNLAVPTEIQSSAASHKALPSLSSDELLYVTTRNFPAEWLMSFRPEELDLDLSTMNNTIPGHHELAQNTKQTFSNGNETLNGTIDSTSRLKPDNHNHPYVSSHESAQENKQMFSDRNEPLNRTTHSFATPKPVKHNRPYVCSHKSCNCKNFSNKSGLERHMREVHSSQNFICPIRSCDRSKKGFHRRHNLREHQKRVHGFRSSNPPRAPSINSEGLSESEESTASPPYEIEAEGASQGIKATDAMSATREDCKIKLQDLRARREKLDGDIKFMERVMIMMGGEH